MRGHVCIGPSREATNIDLTGILTPIEGLVRTAYECNGEGYMNVHIFACAPKSEGVVRSRWPVPGSKEELRGLRVCFPRSRT